MIWDEIGESDGERDKMLLQLEQECLDIYRRKVENTRKYRATLHQSLEEAKLEIDTIVAALGEHASFSQVYCFHLCFFFGRHFRHTCRVIYFWLIWYLY